jgi:serine beta-lactamase-like protein LACTB
MKIFESGKWSRRNKLMLAIVLCGVNGLLAVQSPAQQAATQAATKQESAAKTREISAGRYAEAKENADRQAKEWLARGIPGITMAVAVNGKIVYSEGYGLADLEQRVPVWPTTKFRIASISKPLTAVALMQLVETGKVDLDAPIQKYVPSFPEKGVLITTRMVAGHLAGIRHYKDKEFEISRHYDSVTEGLKIFEDDPLVAPPGTKFSYSSYGFNLVSAVIEAASGENFLAYMQNHVFTPLGMPHTTADQNKQIVEERARFYELAKAGNAENAPYVDNSYKWAGGGFLSTAEDLARFGSALLRPGFLKEESLKQLFSSQKTKAGEETGYGIGWGVGKTSSGKIFYAHSGGAVGGTSQLIMYPESGVVIAMINNLSDAPWKAEEVRAVAEKFIDEGK